MLSSLRDISRKCKSTLSPCKQEDEEKLENATRNSSSSNFCNQFQRKTIITPHLPLPPSFVLQFFPVSPILVEGRTTNVEASSPHLQSHREKLSTRIKISGSGEGFGSRDTPSRNGFRPCATQPGKARRNLPDSACYTARTTSCRRAVARKDDKLDVILSRLVAPIYICVQCIYTNAPFVPNEIFPS